MRHVIDKIVLNNRKPCLFFKNDVQADNEEEEDEEIVLAGAALDDGLDQRFAAAHGDVRFHKADADGDGGYCGEEEV